MKTEFREDLRSKRNDPLDSRSIDFDWNSVEFTPDIKIEMESMLATTIRRLSQYILGKECDVTHAGRRFIALCWVMDPSMFPDTPSLRQLAHRLQIDPSGLSRLTAEITRTYGLRNRAQSHGDGVRKEKAGVE